MKPHIMVWFYQRKKILVSNKAKWVMQSFFSFKLFKGLGILHYNFEIFVHFCNNVRSSASDPQSTHQFLLHSCFSIHILYSVILARIGGDEG